MIISDRYEFSFVHIPKCAGTAVRNRLLPYDDLDGAHENRVGNHPVLGPTDYVHLPLATLRDHFPDKFDRVERYWSFAVVRPPKSRFFSAVSQRLKMYRGTFLHALNEDQLVAEVEEVMAELDRREGRLPPELIHFQRQVDFVLLDGKQMVDSLYLTADINSLLADVAQRVGVDTLPEPKNSGTHAENRSFVFKNNALRLAVEALRPAAKVIVSRLPDKAKKHLRSAVYAAPGDRFEAVAERVGLDHFLTSYYAEDLTLVAKVKGERGS